MQTLRARMCSSEKPGRSSAPLSPVGASVMAFRPSRCRWHGGRDQSSRSKLRREGHSSGLLPLVSSSPSSARPVSGEGPFPVRYGVGVFEISGRESGGSGFDPTWLLRCARRFRHCFRSHIVRRTLLSGQHNQDSIIRTALPISVLRRPRSARCFSLRWALLMGLGDSSRVRQQQCRTYSNRSDRRSCKGCRDVNIRRVQMAEETSRIPIGPSGCFRERHREDEKPPAKKPGLRGTLFLSCCASSGVASVRRFEGDEPVRRFEGEMPSLFQVVRRHPPQY